MKPYSSEIIKAMAAHSDECAAYASAMKWDWLRRQKVKDISELDISQNCAFCEIYNSKPNKRHSNCPLYQASCGCHEFYHTTIAAFRKQDQQAFTENANNLYFQIRSIIDDFYKPEKKCGSCNYWRMEKNGECALEVHHNRSHRFNEKACRGWAPVPGADVKSEPKKEEVFYDIGQKFRQEEDVYVLTALPDKKIILIHRDTGNFWKRGISVKDMGKITESEFRCIAGTEYPFTLIADKK